LENIIKIIATILLLFCFLSLVFCSKEDYPIHSGNPSLTGSWIGGDTSHPITVNALLTQSGTAVTGSGDIQTFNNRACTFSGVNNYPDVSLIISVTGEPDIGFDGVFNNSDTVKGIWMENNAPDLTMIFVRQ
jgi:hypothetical protein